MPLLRYVLLNLSEDSAAANKRGMRILFLVIQTLAGPFGAIVAAWLHRCEGHQGHIVLRTIIEISGMMTFLTRLGHLLRLHTYRSRLLSAIKRILFQKVHAVRGDAPPCYRRFILELFRHTLLRSMHQPRGPSSRAQATADRNRLKFVCF